MQISLKSARLNCGLTLKEASNMVGIHHQTLSKYEKDSSNISISLLDKLSVLYQVPKDYIFLGKQYELIRKIELKRQQSI